MSQRRIEELEKLRDELVGRATFGVVSHLNDKANRLRFEKYKKHGAARSVAQDKTPARALGPTLRVD